jgi:hypothetical protein
MPDIIDINKYWEDEDMLLLLLFFSLIKFSLFNYDAYDKYERVNKKESSMLMKMGVSIYTYVLDIYIRRRKDVYYSVGVVLSIKWKNNCDCSNRQTHFLWLFF